MSTDGDVGGIDIVIAIEVAEGVDLGLAVGVVGDAFLGFGGIVDGEDDVAVGVCVGEVTG